jgi:hypothetical protein
MLAGLSCWLVDADTVKNLGGACQIAGVVLVVWDLLALTRYRGDIERVAARLRGWWTARVAAVRGLFGRPGRGVTVHAGAASGIGIASHVGVRSYPGPFVARPGQSLEDQIAQLGHLVNWLRDDLEAELNERNRAISEERRARQRELQAEAGRLERLIAEALREANDLREVTTGGVRLRWEGVPVLLIGVAFTTWPDGIADGWPGWLPWRVLVLVAAFYAAARLTGLLSMR